MGHEFRKSKTDLGNKIVTNLPDEEHNHLVTIIDRMEKIVLEKTKGEYTLEDVYRNPKLRKKFIDDKF